MLCSKPAIDAHHILDRKLFPDGGYYLDNGASVCELCHLLCENCTYSVAVVRKAAMIRNIILPPGFDPSKTYDKWGNVVQKLYKYPHTPHLPQSRSRTDDDHVLTTTDHFNDMQVVITEKRDGESATLYRDHYHARSLDSVHHPSRDWIKAFWGTLRHDIPESYHICGENMYAQHSIVYNDLETYFEGFSVWQENYCLPWESALEWLELLEIKHVPILYQGPFYKGLIEEMIKSLDIEKQEGFVIRDVRGFSYENFGKHVAKFVRPKHVQTDKNWMWQEIVPNKLRMGD